MKYFELLQLCEYLKGFKKLHAICRVDDDLFKLRLDFKELIFDLGRGSSAIYTRPDEKEGLKDYEKIYQAPLDLILKKEIFNTQIQDLFVQENNRILCFVLLAQRAYKNKLYNLYFEFTGKYTNVILCDEDERVIEALRHVEKSYRVVRPRQILVPLSPVKIREDFVEIKNFDEYFENNFLRLREKKFVEKRMQKLILIDKKISNLQGLLSSLESEELLKNEAKILRNKAELLFANLYKIKDYEREFCLDDFEGEPVEFRLEKNAKLSVDDFYKRAKRLEKKSANLILQRENINEKISFHQNLKVLLEKATNIAELEFLLPKKNTRQKNKDKNEKIDENKIAIFYFNKLKISVGKNENGNEILLKNAKKNELWFHLRDLPGAHVILSGAKELEQNEEALNFAAKLCLNFSKTKVGTFWVDYTRRENVKIIRKALVNYTKFKSLRLKKE